MSDFEKFSKSKSSEASATMFCAKAKRQQQCSVRKRSVSNNKSAKVNLIKRLTYFMKNNEGGYFNG
ncbi:hypothetical protein [Lysinibacillus sphaericus]|uniref:hypothetical protein n=1 Tax=Lysinibacillus sphaericus TaxID=1421 RepID=UPI003D002BA7